MERSEPLSASEHSTQETELAQQIADLQAEITRLRTQNRFLLAAVNEMASGMIVTDAGADQPIVFVNRAFSTITGYAPNEVLGRNCRFLQGPQTDAATVARLREAIAAARPIQERILNYRKDGQPFWNQLSISPVRDETGNVVAFVGVQTDVTAQVAVEQALAEREQLLRAVEKMASVGGWELDLATGTMVWSEEMFAIHELPVGDIPPSPELIDFYPAEVHHLINEVYERCLATGAEWDLALPFRTAKGNLRWVRSIGQPVWENGRIVKLRGTFQDITRTKENELALRASEQRYRMLADMLPGTIVLMFNTDFRLTLAAGPELARFGVTSAQLEGRLLPELLPEPHYSKLLPLCYEVLNGATHRIDYVVDHQVFDTTLLPIEITPGHVSGGLIVGRNITVERQIATDLLRAKEAAEQAERARTSFLAAISHEMRTPLNAVIASTEVLLRGGLTDEQRDFVETIRIGSESLLTLINNVLDLSKLEAGQVELEPKPTDLRAIITTVCELFRREAVRKGLHMGVRIDPALPPLVIVDGVRVRQIVTNLVSNAIKFTDHGSVSITVELLDVADDRCQVAIRVSDTGIGITSEHLPKLFQPFIRYRSEQVRRDGARLGLAISAQLASLMGGELRADSRLGEGSTFTLSLLMQRVVAPVEPSKSVGSPSSVQTPALHILVAEDNEINQQVALHLLRVLGHHVTVVANGREALHSVQHGQFDVVLMDLQMPEMDGEEVTRQIRALGNRIRQPRIIALTAYAFAGIRERCLAAGMDGFLNKPVRLQDLRDALHPPTDRRDQMAHSITTDEELVIDWATFNELLAALGGDQIEIRRTTCALIRHEFQQQLDQVTVAIARRDREQVRQIAHRLKGGARQVGAVLVAAAAQALERAATTDQPLEAFLSGLQQAVAETLRVLQVG
ncbi:PAS domain-containing protein [Chloroflexus aggregans]|uniref:Circadian input-output histidine kinase CikA n=1 Tax=Chloroflexus aggregans (strain MD-66 / DSM 9485) TaxID=326427 RepID=B8GAY9_CHLAD|nr:PAS domain-containing protein [Chloroflexus aggregans]ACL26589.1 multi-sensor hybrid histidine kinase [Chloroflexus aggregans DSM 9485]